MVAWSVSRVIIDVTSINLNGDRLVIVYRYGWGCTVNSCTDRAGEYGLFDAAGCIMDT